MKIIPGTCLLTQKNYKNLDAGIEVLDDVILKNENQMKIPSILVQAFLSIHQI